MREALREQTFYLDIKLFDELSKRHGSLPDDYYITYKGYKAKVFTREMEIILCGKDLPILGEVAVFWQHGLFLKDYIFGYKDGQDFFDNGYEKRKLFEIDAKAFIKNLYHLCYKSFPKRNTGFIFYTKNYPHTLNQKMIYEFGYYSGFLVKIEEIRSKNRKLFDLHFNDKA